MRLLLRSRWFWLGLVVRLGAMPFFGSYYLNELFIPFLDNAVLSPTHNPWTLSAPQSFPYGSALFAILFVPRWIAYQLLGSAALGTGWLGTLLVKLPLLGLELVLLVSLITLVTRRADSILKFYWLNPIAIYVSYVHGQLDVAAMALSMVAIVLLIRQRAAASALAMAAATLCKFHVAAIMPFLLVYQWNRHFAREAVRRMSTWTAVYAVVTILGFVPLVYADRLLYASTASPEAFRIFSAHLTFGNESLYLGVMATIAVLGRLCLSTKITDWGLVFGCAAVFGTLLVVTQPGPGWFLWILPFIALFLATYLNMPRSPLGVLVAVYFIYYLGFDTFGPAGVAKPATLYSGIVFTVLQTTLGGILAAIWLLAVRRENPLRRRAQPVLIGIAGDSGAGKNHLCTLVQDVFGPGHTVVVEGDDYHKWERANVRWQDYTHLHPKANHLTQLASHASDLARGLAVFQPHYDHSTGTFTAPRELKPGRAVVVQGLHTLYLRGLREAFDLRIFLAPDDLVRLHWKLTRDVRERGHPIEKVLQSLESRAADSEAHIAPQRAYADWIIEYFADGADSRDDVIAGRVPQIAVRHMVWNDAPVQDLLDAVAAVPGARFDLDNDPEDLNRLALCYRGRELTAEEIAGVAERVYPDLRTITRARTAPSWRSGFAGITQLVLVSLLRSREYSRN